MSPYDVLCILAFALAGVLVCAALLLLAIATHWFLRAWAIHNTEVYAAVLRRRQFEDMDAAAAKAGRPPGPRSVLEFPSPPSAA